MLIHAIALGGGGGGGGTFPPNASAYESVYVRRHVDDTL